MYVCVCVYIYIYIYIYPCMPALRRLEISKSDVFKRVSFERSSRAATYSSRLAYSD